MVKKYQQLLLIPLGLIVLVSCIPTQPALPEWPTPGPVSTPPHSIIPDWGEMIIYSVCIEIEQSYTIVNKPYVIDSLSDDPLNILDKAEKFFKDVGIQVSSDSSSCDGKILIYVEGETISASYSDLGGCHTGVRLDVQLTLSVGDQVVSSERYSDSIEPLHTISRCAEPSTPDTFIRVASEPLFFALVYPWGSSTYGSALINVFTQPDIPSNKLSAAVPFLIQSLKSEDENIQKKGIIALGHIGSPAVEAIPYLLRYWEEQPDGVMDMNLKRALMNIAEDCINCDYEEWRKWWRDNSENLLSK